jgi:hypothetical protein
LNKSWVIIGGILLVIILVWVFSGSSISCHESFWDRNKQVIEIKH